jgi:tyrosine-protein phosphatase YwqE
MRILERDPPAYTINGSQYLLIELSDYGFPLSMDEIIFRLETLGTIPIITHPEQNRA